MKRRLLPVLASESALWHEPHLAQQLGCGDCPDRPICGGLQTRAGFIDCRELCPCNWGRLCTGLCRRDHRTFIKRVREVGGFAFDNVARVTPVAAAVEPYVPIV